MSAGLPRRTFLKGLGLSMGLPLLEAMQPARALAAGRAATGPTRMAFVFFPNGAIMDAWKPTETGASYKLPETLDALSSYKSDINVLTGLAQNQGFAHGDGAGDHARCASTYLTGAHPVKTSGADIRAGISVDQVAALQIGSRTKLPSLEIGLEGGRNAGSCDSGYACAYSSNVSWKSPTTPMAKEINPRLAFERLFGSGSQADEGKARRDFYRKSILDIVAEDALKLQQELGQTDRRKMDEYFTSVRELEQRIVRAEQHATNQRPDVEIPSGVPKDTVEHMRLMYEILVLAFRTDSTRIATYMLGNAGSNRSYSNVGVKEGHHQLSHHQNDQEKVAKIKKIDRFLAEQFAAFLGQLKAIREGEGTLLENCMIMYGSGLSDGNRHRHNDLPIVLAGKAGGTIATGRHLKFDSEAPLNNLFLSMLDRVGADVQSLGDSSGRLTEL